MFRYRLAYLLLIGFGVFFYIAFVGYFSYYFLLLILILPVLSLFYLVMSFKFTKLDFAILNQKVIQDDFVKIKIIKDNLGLGAIRFVVEDQKYLIKGNQDGLTLVFKHCGGRNFIINTYYQYDCLNLFCIKKRCHYEIPITIYPKRVELDFKEYAHQLPRVGDEVYAVNRKGDDPTEIYDIHKYQEGDQLKNIHWKLSARYQDILVKDNAMLVGEVINLYVSFDDNDDHNDLVFGYLDTFCGFLLKRQIGFLLSNKEIKSIQEYDEMFKYLLWNKEYQSDISKHNYEFVISYNGIMKVEGSSNNHFIFISCIIVGLLIYLGFNYIQGKKKFVIGSIIADGILLLIPSTMDCLTYITSIIIYKYREVSVYDFNFESTYIFYDDPQICILAFLLIFIPLFLSAVIAIDKQKYTLAILALLPGVFIELLFTITPPWYFLACYVLYVLILLIGALQKGAILKIPMIIISVVAMAITYISFPISTYRPSKYSLFDNARTPISTPGNIKEEYNVNSQGDRHYRNSLDFTIAGEVTLNNFKIRGIAYDLYEDGKWGTSHSRVETEWFKNNLEKIANITKTSRQVIEVNQISGYSQRNYTPYFIINDDMTYYGDHYEGNYT